MIDERVCVTCGTVGTPVRYIKGSFGMELGLWLLFIVPGLLYSIWRLTTRSKVCPSCQSEDIIPTISPNGRKILIKIEQQNQSAQDLIDQINHSRRSGIGQ